MKNLINLRKIFATLAQRLRRPCAATESCYRLVSVPLSSRFRLVAILYLLLMVSVGNAWGDTYYKKINSLDDVTTGDYVIIGCQTSSSFGLLTYGTLSSNRIPYTKSYSAYSGNDGLPTTITNPAGASVWTLTVTVSNNVKSVTLYNATNSKYIASNATTHDGKYKYDSNSGLSFTIQYNSGSYGTFRMFAGSTYYLGVNKSADYWRGYASGTLTDTYGLTLYKEAHTVTYNNNGGSGTMTDSNSPYVLGTTVTVKTNTFTNTGNTFSKWNTKADGSGQDFAEGAKFSISKDTTFYAQWVSAGTSVSLTKAGETNGSLKLSQTANYIYIVYFSMSKIVCPFRLLCHRAKSITL